MVDANAIKERVLGSEEKSIQERVREKFESAGLRKSRIYVEDESDVPDQYSPQTSDRGAVYYETDSGTDAGAFNDVDADDVYDALGDVDDAEMEMEMREAGIDPDDYRGPKELGPAAGMVLQDVAMDRFGVNELDDEVEDALEDIGTEWAEDWFNY